ncbi:hypothetical protein D9Q98_001612 [Chlorella vulgaris]|uniref:Uncharacterized protein n=1 Tax=Chlorella vulgaris TaxID=3077 RepID=A0A9D4TW28_CHLVU|nr:hypothetical protein D9Q98_001612 [Chlorella vulgaris]
MQSTPKKSAGKRPAARPPKKTKKKSIKDSKPASGGAVGGGPAAAAEQERKRLVTELEMTAAGLRAREAEAKGLQLELAALRLRHGQDVATAQDVLHSQQRERAVLEEAARALEKRLEAACAETALLRVSLQQAQAAGTATTGQQARKQGECEQHAASSEVWRLQCQSQQQAEHIAAQQETIERLRQRLEHTEQSLEAERGGTDMTAWLAVRGQARSQLRFVRESPWLVHIRPQRLGGVLPNSVLPGSCLALAGRQLLLEGPEEEGQELGGGGPAGQLHMLDLSSGQWSARRRGVEGAPSPGQPPASIAPVSGRAMCGIGDKLLGVGGTCCGQLLGTKVFHPSLREWLPLPPPADASALQPPLRHSAALAYCPASHVAYLFGGQGEAGCLADLWCLNCTSMEWRQLDTVSSRPGESARLQGSLDAPPPSSGAALAVSEDGSRLWLMGGRLDSQRCSNALHRYDLGLSYWARVDAAPPIEPRANHVMSCVDRFLVIVGGSIFSADGQAAHLQDCALYDPTENSWDVLDGAAFEPDAGSSKGHPAAVVSVAAGMIAGNGTPASSKPAQRDGEPAAFLGAGSCVFSGNKLLLLKALPDSGGRLGELWTVVLQLPGDIELLRESQRKAACVVKQLTLFEEEVSAASVRLGWTPATAKRDRLVSYKLMVTNSEGRSREAYEGCETSCQVTGLMPGSHIFCVKAVYDDASFQWSQPVMAVTTPAKRGPT